MLIPLVGGSNPHRSVSVSAELTTNMYPVADPNAKHGAAMYARPGLVNQIFATAGSAEVRGFTTYNDELYAVVGGDVKKVNSSGAVTTLGSIGTVSGVASLAAGRTQVGIVDGQAGYYTTGTSLSTITDSDFPNGATHLVYFNDRFFANDPDNAGRDYASDEADVSSWGSTALATAQRKPDALQGLAAIPQYLLKFGTETMEPWGDTGGTPYPLEPFPGGSGIGLAAPHSLASLAEEVFWLGQAREGTGAVFRGGIQANQISHPALENEFAGYSTISDARGFCFASNGERFYVLTFPTADRTWVCHLNTLTRAGPETAWTRWKSYGLGRWRPNCHAFFADKHLVGDYADGNIYELSFDAYSDAGARIERERRIRVIIDADRHTRLFHTMLELEFEFGVGTASLDPQVMVSWSDDRGHTYSNERTVSLGNVGKYGARGVLRRLGVSRDRVYRFRILDECCTAISGAYLTVERGDS